MMTAPGATKRGGTVTISRQDHNGARAAGEGGAAPPDGQEMIRPYDETEFQRKFLLRNVLKMTQAQLAEEWEVTQPMVARLLSARGRHGETRSLEKELDFVRRVNEAAGSNLSHADLWPPHRAIEETDPRPQVLEVAAAREEAEGRRRKKKARSRNERARKAKKRGR